MNRTPVSSTTLTSVGYDPGTLTLELEFTSGTLYQYFDVPESVHLELLSASSLGKYFNQSIRNTYRCVQM